MLNDYLSLAFKNLSHRKLRSWLTLIGIFIGVTAVVSLIGLGDGLRTAVNSQFGVSMTEVITIEAGGATTGPPGSGVAEPLKKDSVDKIERLKSVDIATSRTVEQIKMEFNDEVNYDTFSLTIPDGKERDFAYEAIGVEAMQGRMLKDGDNKRVVLGYNFGEDKVGFGEEIKDGDNVKLFGKNFEVVGVLEKEGSFIFDNIVLINENVLRDLKGLGDKVDIIAAKVKDRDLIDKAKEDIEEVMREEREVDEGEEDFVVKTPEGMLSNVNQILTGIQIFIILIASISVFIGAVGIVNTMITAVLERRSQIGVLKSIGAKNKDIFWLFFIEAGMMGFFGGLLGVVAGELITFGGIQGINSLIGSEIEPSLNLLLVGLTLVGSFLIGSLSGIYPALSAAKQNPVEALRS